MIQWNLSTFVSKWRSKWRRDNITFSSSKCNGNWSEGVAEALSISIQTCSSNTSGLEQPSILCKFHQQKQTTSKIIRQQTPNTKALVQNTGSKYHESDKSKQGQDCLEQNFLLVFFLSSNQTTFLSLLVLSRSIFEKLTGMMLKTKTADNDPWFFS